MTFKSRIAFGLSAAMVSMAWGGAAHAEEGDLSIAVTVGYSDPSSTAFNDGTNGGGNPQADIEGDIR